MKLEAVSAELRLRQPWEAVDLGVALLRANAGPVYRAWFAVVIPLFVLLHLLCFSAPWLVPWILWWLKPLLDRVVLYVLSRTLFGEVPTVRQVWRALPGEWWRDGLSALTLRRLSPARSFVLPVSQLEHLRGRERRARLRVLGRRDGSRAVGLTLICLNLEIILAMGLVALAAMSLPNFVLENALEALLEAPHLQQLLLSLAALGALSVMEPCYVACGFALYLNRRTWLEAWDLEIGFRQLARRLGALTLCLGVLGAGLLHTPGWSAEPDDEPRISKSCQQRAAELASLARDAGEIKPVLAQVLEEEAFQRCRILSGWQLELDDAPPEAASSPQPWVGGLALLMEGLLWILLGVALVLFGVWLYRQPVWRTVTRRAVPKASTVVILGESIQADQLDPDAHQRAWRLWQSGEQRQALGLLYRASLAALLTAGVKLGRASTEEECLARAAGQVPVSVHDYLHRLTRRWQALAYGHQAPASEEMARLCRDWPRQLLALTQPQEDTP